MSRLLIAVALCIVAAGNAFHMRPIRNVARVGRLFGENDEEVASAKTPAPVTPKPAKTTELAPVNDETIASAAGVTGGVFGFLLGGPIFALLFGTATIYVSKKDNEVAEGIRGVGKAVVESYNYFTKLNNKFNFTGKVSESVKKTIDEAAVDSDAIGQLKGAFAKVDEINTEYDITGKAITALGATATLSEAAYEKIEELNEKYDFVEQGKKAANKAAEKIKQASSD